MTERFKSIYNHPKTV